MKFDYKKILQEQNWLLSAAIVLVIYGIMLLLLHGFAPGEKMVLKYLVHGLPALALVMAVYGWFDRRRKDEEEAQRKRRKFETNKLLDRARKEEQIRGGKK